MTWNHNRLLGLECCRWVDFALRSMLRVGVDRSRCYGHTGFMIDRRLRASLSRELIAPLERQTGGAGADLWLNGGLRHGGIGDLRRLITGI